MEKIVVISDLQCPLHDKRAVRNVTDFVKDYRPDVLANVGDEVDVVQPARWSKGFAVEYSGTLQRDLEVGFKVQKAFRDALGPDKPFHVMRSNHVDRLETYVAKYAPAFNNMDVLKIENLMRYDEIGVTYHRALFELAPGWLLAHGDEGSLSPLAGRTPSNLAVKLGKSIVSGHSHRAGISPHTTSYVDDTGKIHQSTVYGMEIGNLMDLKQASYLKAGSANWQQAFGILHVEGRRVHPQLVFIQSDGSFVVDGRRYG